MCEKERFRDCERKGEEGRGKGGDDSESDKEGERKKNEYVKREKRETEKKERGREILIYSLQRFCTHCHYLSRAVSMSLGKRLNKKKIE